MTADKRPTSGDALLRIRNLVIEGQSDRGVVHIIRGIDLDLQRGEVLGLIGESGAGKSTLGLAAMGFTRDGCSVASGSIEFDGIDLTNSSVQVRQRLRATRIAYVAQSAAASFNPAQPLIDQAIENAVQYAGVTPAQAKADAIALYRQLQLPDPDQIGFRYPHQVSGGQLQRAMTVMAMVAKPDLIVFDEPTTALDVTTQIEVLAAIRNAVEAIGTSAIYISHDLALVAQMADRIMVLRHGELVESADTRTMLQSPQKDYTRSLWAVRSFRASPKPPPDAAAEPLLAVQSVTAAYQKGAAPVLRKVSLALYAGRTTAIVGESGSGKSTLSRVITGLLPPREGTVLFENALLTPDYRQRTRDRLRKIQLIAQSPDTALNPRQRVRDIIGRPLSFYLGLRGAERTQKVRALLTEIELDPDIYADRFPSELSGGQKQRVCIARALAADPSLLICDEVTSALDQLVAEEVLKLLDRLQRERGLSYLFITHDLATVRAIADDVLVMKDGEVVDAGSRDRIFAPPFKPYTELLLSSLPEMDPDWLDQLLATRRANAGPSI